MVLSELLLSGKIYVSFADIRDASKASEKIQSVRQDWNIQQIAATYVNKQDQLEDLNCPPEFAFEGQVVVRAEYSGRGLLHVGDVGSLIKDLLANYGKIMAYRTCHATPPSVAYRAEFYNTIAADNALAHLNGFKLAVRILSRSRCRQPTDYLRAVY